jgi:hypothetical protein
MRPIQARVCQILKQFVSLKFDALDTNLLRLLKIIAHIMDDRLGMTLQYTIIKEVSLSLHSLCLISLQSMILCMTHCFH